MDADKKPIEFLEDGVTDLKQALESCDSDSERCSSVIARIEEVLMRMREGYLVSLADLNLKDAIEAVSRSFGSVSFTNGRGAIEETTAGLQEVIDRLCTLSLSDGLTGLYNHRYFRLQIQVEVKRAVRFEHPLTLIMLDLDHFKKVNDTYGHPFGDKVLKGFADILKNTLRLSDLSVRYGGEEFAVLLPNTQIEQAYFVAEKLKTVIGETAFLCGEDPVHITFSAGLAQLRARKDEAADEFIKRADGLLYQAKEEGRNRIVFDQADMDAVKHSEVSTKERSNLFGILSDLDRIEDQG